MFKKPKFVWKTVHRILKLNSEVTTTSPEDLNNFLSDIAKNLMENVQSPYKRQNYQI